MLADEGARHAAFERFMNEVRAWQREHPGAAVTPHVPEPRGWTRDELYGRSESADPVQLTNLGSQ